MSRRRFPILEWLSRSIVNEPPTHDLFCFLWKRWHDLMIWWDAKACTYDTKRPAEGHESTGEYYDGRSRTERLSWYAMLSLGEHKRVNGIYVLMRN